MRKPAFLILFLVLVLALQASAIGTPSVQSSTHPSNNEYYTESCPSFNWSELTGARGYSYKVNKDPDHVPDEVSEGLATQVTMPCKLDGEWYFHIRANSTTEWGETARYRFLIDKTPASAPQNLVVEALQGAMKLSWDASVDIHSGVKDYTIYRDLERDFDIRFAEVIAEGVSETTYTDTEGDFGEGRAYYYKVVAFDKAGNQGTISPQAFATAPRICDIDIEWDLPKAIKGDSLDIKISTSDGSDMYNIYLSVREGGGDAVAILQNQSDISSVDVTHNISDSSVASVEVIFKTRDSLLGDPCDENRLVLLDAGNPTGGWVRPATNTTLSGISKLELTASDAGNNASGIDMVDLYYYDKSWIEIASLPGSQTVTTYSYDWNTLKVDNGRYEVKVVVRDKADNTVEDLVVVNIANLENVMKSVDSKIQKAKDDKAETDNTRFDLESKGIDVSKLLELSGLADENLTAAQASFTNQDYDTALQQAEAASSLYTQARDSVSVSTKFSKDYAFSSSDVAELLGKVGLSQALREEAEGLINTNEIKRRLELLEVSENGGTYYLASITLEFVNITDAPLSVQVVEVIPKAFAASADLLSSESEFSVVVKDPIISFSAPELSPNGSIKFVYSLTTRLSLEESDAFASEDVLSRFPTPPIVLNSSTALTPTTFTPPLEMPNLFAFPELGTNSSLLLMIGVAVIIILLIIVIALLLAFIFHVSFLRRERRARYD